MIRSYQKAGLLIIDEFLLTPMTNEQANDLIETIEPRAERGSVIFCPSLNLTAGMNGSDRRSMKRSVTLSLTGSAPMHMRS